MKDKCDELVELAGRLGASEAVIIPAIKIPVDDRVPEMCQSPRCYGFDQSANCPPHVPGPAWFREFIRGFQKVLVFRIDFPREVLSSYQRVEAFRMLHFLGAEVERQAVGRGCERARAFAGDSCKILFCSEHSRCRIIGEKGECRHPEIARPSMSGFGVEVRSLKRIVGWDSKSNKFDCERKPAESLVGMVLLE